MLDSAISSSGIIVRYLAEPLFSAALVSIRYSSLQKCSDWLDNLCSIPRNRRIR